MASRTSNSQRLLFGDSGSAKGINKKSHWHFLHFIRRKFRLQDRNVLAYQQENWPHIYEMQRKFWWRKIKQYSCFVDSKASTCALRLLDASGYLLCETIGIYFLRWFKSASGLLRDRLSFRAHLHALKRAWKKDSSVPFWSALGVYSVSRGLVVLVFLVGAREM